MSWDMNMEEKMSKVRRVYSEKMPAFAVKAKELSDEISNYLNINTVKNVRVLIRYDIENISDEVYKDALVTVFSEPPVDYVYEEDFGKKAGEKVFAVEFLPGQFDQRADSAVQCVKLLKEDEEPVIRTATVYCLLYTSPSPRDRTRCEASQGGRGACYKNSHRICH